MRRDNSSQKEEKGMSRFEHFRTLISAMSPSPVCSGLE
jgi:hypothetical protein